MKKEREKLRDEVEKRRVALKGVDPKDPLNLIFHAYRLLGKIMKQHNLVPAEEERGVLDGLHTYLLNNGYVE